MQMEKHILSKEGLGLFFLITLLMQGEQHGLYTQDKGLRSTVWTSITCVNPKVGMSHSKRMKGMAPHVSYAVIQSLWGVDHIR